MKRWLREPLLYFALIGAALFAIDALRDGSSEDSRPDKIVITQGRLQNLAAVFAKTWQRPPTPAELKTLVDDFVLEEALYREGLAMKLDKNDTVVRRRVRQKMDFVVDDVFDLLGPTEHDLQGWLAAHPESYARPGRFTFRHVFLSPERRGESLQQDVRRALAELRTSDRADAYELGDPFLLGYAFKSRKADRIAQTFGKKFVAGLAKLPIGEWSGPMQSSYGVHLVRVDARVDGESPDLAEVRAAVERDWRFTQRQKARAQYHARLLERYAVTIEWPKGEAEARRER